MRQFQSTNPSPEGSQAATNGLPPPSNSGNTLEHADNHQNDRKAAQTMSRAFNAKASIMLDISNRSNGNSKSSKLANANADRKTTKKTVSPLKSPESGYLRPAEPNRLIPLRLSSLPRSPGVYIPALPCLPLEKLSSVRVKKTFIDCQTGLNADGRNNPCLYGTPGLCRR